MLFNTWPDASEPPLGVRRDDAAVPSDPVVCRPRAEWREAPWGSAAAEPSAGTDQPATATMKLWLLGDVARRGQMERTLLVPVVRGAALAALSEPVQCTLLEPPTPSPSPSPSPGGSTLQRSSLPQLTGAQRRTLRAHAARLAAVKELHNVKVSDCERSRAEVDRQRAVAELVRCRFSVTKKAEAKAMATGLAESTGAAVAEVLGHTALLYRPSPKRLIKLD